MVQNGNVGWRRPEILLMLMAAVSPLSFATWQSLLNNFAIDRAAFNGANMGMLQTLREVPGFLSFAVVFLLLILSEQTVLVLSMALLGIGTALTGLFPSVIGLYCTTVLMSTGFHFAETANQSLSLQWLEKSTAPRVFGRILSVGAFASLAAYGLIYVVLKWLSLDYVASYGVAGLATAVVALGAWALYPKFPTKVTQHKHLVLRTRYWLYYVFTFLSGARRQIFVVFAGFMMVEKFHYGVTAITGLFLINQLINLVLAPLVGRLIERLGERMALMVEHAGLIVVFLGYAVVEDADWAAVLYVIDNLFFSMTIALKTYLQKIADPADLAPTSGVAFSINHIAAVVIPVTFGLLWLENPSWVFEFGAGLAAVALGFTVLVPRHPEPGFEAALWGNRLAVEDAAAE
jgi:hypothetical protein